MQLNMTCPACRGNGIALDAHSGNFVRCPYCGGKGVVPRRFNRQRFDYAFPTVVLSAAGTPTSVPLQLDSDADFEHTGWSLFDGLSAATFPRYTIYVINQSSGQRLMNESSITQSAGNAPALGIAAINFAGGPTPSAGIAPFQLVEPYVWKKGTVFQATFTPPALISPAVTVQLVMKGYKLYPISNGNGGQGGSNSQSKAAA